MNSLHSLPLAGLVAGCAALLLMGCVTESVTLVNSCVDLRCGTRVLVTQRNGAVTSGQFLAMENMPFADYLAVYRRFAAEFPECAALPVPGERISFGNILAPGHVWKGTLIGFCPENLWVRLSGDRDVTRFYIYGLSHLTRLDGRTVFRSKIRELMNANRLPLLTRMVVQTLPDTARIALNEVARLEIEEHGSPRNVDIFASGGR